MTTPLTTFRMLTYAYLMDHMNAFPVLISAFKNKTNKELICYEKVLEAVGVVDGSGRKTVLEGSTSIIRRQ